MGRSRLSQAVKDLEALVGGKQRKRFVPLRRALSKRLAKDSSDTVMAIARMLLNGNGFPQHLSPTSDQLSQADDYELRQKNWKNWAEASITWAAVDTLPVISLDSPGGSKQVGINSSRNGLVRRIAGGVELPGKHCAAEQ